MVKGKKIKSLKGHLSFEQEGRDVVARAKIMLKNPEFCRRFIAMVNSHTDPPLAFDADPSDDY